MTTTIATISASLTSTPNLKKSIKKKKGQFSARNTNITDVSVSHQKQPRVNLCFLSHEHWSPRYDVTFYTIQFLNSTEILHKNGDLLEAFDGITHQSHPPVPGNTDFPAVYYTIEVLYGHSRHIIKRRYSQFRWLYDQLSGIQNPLPNHEHLKFPPKSIFSWFSTTCIPPNEEFTERRLVKLNEFVNTALKYPCYSQHESIVVFLETWRVKKYLLEEST